MKKKFEVDITHSGVSFCCSSSFSVNFGGVGWSFGLRPKSHSCYGISISERSISWLPDGDISVNFPIFLSYQKNTKEGNVLSDTTVYCLGQDYWQGE